MHEKNTFSLRRVVALEAQATFKTLTGKSWCYLKSDKVEALTDELLYNNLLPVTMYANYIYEQTRPNTHFASIFKEKYIAMCVGHNEFQSKHIRTTVQGMVDTFNASIQYMELEKLLGKQKDYMSEVFRWCMACRYAVNTNNPEELNEHAAYELLCSPWYFQCVDVLPELKSLAQLKQFIARKH